MLEIIVARRCFRNDERCFARYRFAEQRFFHTFQNEHKSFAARVHDARFFKNGQKRRRDFHGSVAFFYDFAEKSLIYRLVDVVDEVVANMVEGRQTREKKTIKESVDSTMKITFSAIKSNTLFEYLKNGLFSFCSKLLAIIQFYNGQYFLGKANAVAYRR